MIRGLAAIVALASLPAVTGGGMSPNASPTKVAVGKPQDHCSWLSSSLAEAETIKVGFTRSALLKVFDGDGGLSNGLRRTYVYRGCPLIKVDVEFLPTDRPARDSDGRVTVIESGSDVIVEISRPYLALPVSD